MATDTPVWAVVPAAGIGSRMQQELPKQYLEFQGKTILEHCLDRLLAHPQVAGAVLVLRADDRYWESLNYAPNKPLFTTEGGAERQHSVYSGLTTLQYRCGNDVIALVHDAVRPLVSFQDLDRVIAAARNHTAGAILAAPVADTLKRDNGNGEIDATVDRAGLWRALTPQVFHLQPLLNGLRRILDVDGQATDEAAAVEALGYTPALVAGDVSNLKITRPDDLRLAERIWLDQCDQQGDE